MEKNATYLPNAGYDPETLTPQNGCTDNAAFEQFVQLKQMLCKEVDDENKALKEENEELKASNKEKDDTIVSQATQIMKLKKELLHAQEIINTAEKCKDTGDPRPMFKYEYDLSDFKESAEIKDIDFMFECLLCLTEVMLKPGLLLINSASDIIPIYLVLTKDNKLGQSNYQFRGTLKVFCDYWNVNIVPHIKDEDRREALTCNYASIKATINKAPWKQVDPSSWRRLSYEATKKKKAYQHALNIKERIVNLMMSQSA